MSDREKLIAIMAQGCRKSTEENGVPCCDELFCKDNQKSCYGETADHLIANGVTFATDNNVGGKWIPVTEQEEPTENGTYLCHGYWFGSRRKQTETADFFGEWNIANNFILTHWMPLPEPPMRKGENDVR